MIHPILQNTLFKTSKKEVIEYYKISKKEASKWYKLNYLSFDFDSLDEFEESQFLEISFENLLAEPDKIMQEICDFAEINYSKKMQDIVKKMPEVNVS